MKRKSFIQLMISMVLLFLVTSALVIKPGIDNKRNLRHASYVSLDGQVLHRGNQLETDGNVHQFNSPVITINAHKIKIS